MIGLQLDKRFKKSAKGQFEKYSFEVGVLKDGAHKLPRRGVRGKGGRDVQTVYAGGPVRKKSYVDSGVQISQVSKENRERLGINYLTEPFKKKNSDIMRFTARFFQVVTGRSQPKRLENLLQAIVRNPILKGSYGSNSLMTKKIKGFNRLMIDTAQLFKAIQARVVKKVSSV